MKNTQNILKIHVKVKLEFFLNLLKKHNNLSFILNNQFIYIIINLF